MSRLLDKKVNGRWPFAYTPAAATDVGKTFDRIRREQKRLVEEREVKVTEIRRKHG